MSEATKDLHVYGYESPIQSEHKVQEEESNWSFSVTIGRTADLDVEIDTKGLTKQDILKALADALLEEEDREEFGMNLDALYDVLTDFKKGDEVRICFNHWFDSALTAREREQFECVAYDAVEAAKDAQLRVLFLHRNYRSAACD